MSSQADRVRDAWSRIEPGRSADSPDAAEIRIGLLGRGIGASLTPVMHEREGHRLGLRYRYQIIDFDQLDLVDADLGDLLGMIEAAGFRGVNVTYPFKQAIIPHLDVLEDSAAAIGAVNTVTYADGRRYGHNTDCFGFAESVRRGLGAVPFQRVMQIGAGGAGAAVAQALADLGTAALDIVDVDVARAQALALKVASINGIAARGLGPDCLSSLVPDASGLVNATPIGMEKMPGQPVNPGLLTPGQWVADIVYFPRETELIRNARARGCPVLPGGGMAVFQAVRAFELFSGVAADSTEMARTFAAYA